MKRPRSAFAAVVLSSVLVLSPGCSSWQAMAPPAASGPTDRPLPARLRVVLRSDVAFILHEPRVVGDSLFGIRELQPDARTSLISTGGERESSSVALKDVRTLEERKPDSGATAVLLIPVIVIVVLAIVFVVSVASEGY